MEIIEEDECDDSVDCFEMDKLKNALVTDAVNQSVCETRCVMSLFQKSEKIFWAFVGKYGVCPFVTDYCRLIGSRAMLTILWREEAKYEFFQMWNSFFGMEEMINASEAMEAWCRCHLENKGLVILQTQGGLQGPVPKGTICAILEPLDSDGIELEEFN